MRRRNNKHTNPSQRQQQQQDKAIFIPNDNNNENITYAAIWSGRNLHPNEKYHNNKNNVWVVVDGGFHNKEPWQQPHPNDDDWEDAVREVRNFGTGILWLLIVRGFIVQCLRTRFRSDRILSS
jgi:hypothetical protein